MPLSPRHGAWRRTALWFALGLVLAGVGTLKWPLSEWRTGRQDVAPLVLSTGDQFSTAAQRIWIDTDAACGTAPRADPDDCLAILLLAGAPQLQWAGISTVFGNAALDITDRTTRQLVAALSASQPMRVSPMACMRGSPRAWAAHEHGAMGTKAQVQIAAVLAAYEFSEFKLIGDIGGGRGHLLSAVQRALESAALEDNQTPEQAKAAATSWAPLFDRHGLSATQSAQLADIAISTRRNPPDEATISRWQAESREALAAEYSPAGSAQALSDARLVVQSDPALKRFLEYSGLGDHPRVVAAVAARARELRKAGRLPGQA